MYHILPVSLYLSTHIYIYIYRYIHTHTHHISHFQLHHQCKLHISCPSWCRTGLDEALGWGFRHGLPQKWMGFELENAMDILLKWMIWWWFGATPILMVYNWKILLAKMVLNQNGWFGDNLVMIWWYYPFLGKNIMINIYFWKMLWTKWVELQLVDSIF